MKILPSCVFEKVLTFCIKLDLDERKNLNEIKVNGIRDLLH